MMGLSRMRIGQLWKGEGKNYMLGKEFFVIKYLLTIYGEMCSRWFWGTEQKIKSESEEKWEGGRGGYRLAVYATYTCQTD